VIVRIEYLKIGDRIIMVGTRRGRNRKSGPREKNGRPQREKIDVDAIAASMPHRAWIPPRKDKNGKMVDQRRDHKAENPFGRLLLVGSITEVEYEAGQKFRRDYLRYRTAIDSPRGEAPSLTGRLSASDYSEGDAPIPIRVQKPMSDDEFRTRLSAYDAAYRAAKTDDRGMPSVHALRVMNSVVVHERELQPGDREFLKAALGRLIKHYAKPVGAARRERLTAIGE
jgi:hypothetical protein